MGYQDHEPIMTDQVVNNLIVNRSGDYIDCTFGLGGHTTAILKILKSEAKLTGMDRDPESLKLVNKLSKKDKRFSFIKDTFGNLKNYFLETSIDGIILDLGISSSQLDDPKRGFSFQVDGPLDMRMDQTNEFSAKRWINESSQEEISKVLWEKGEERRSRKIAELICKERKVSPIVTTLQLSQIIQSCKSKNSKRHPATNIFRAIRMEVNSEIEELKNVLIAAGEVLKEGGRLGVISFHSLEDRVVKRFIQGKSSEGESFSFKKVGPKYMKPDKEEVENNPRSRSAILRIAEKVA